MMGINTPTVTTQMVELKAIWNGADQKLIGDAVGGCHRIAKGATTTQIRKDDARVVFTGDAELAITVSEKRPSPWPALIVCSTIDLRPEAVREGASTPNHVPIIAQLTVVNEGDYPVVHGPGKE